MKQDLADELARLGWPSVAADVREGVELSAVLARLQAIGEGESDAALAIREALTYDD